MNDGLSDTGIRGRLLAMDLTALRLDDQMRRADLVSPSNNGAATEGASVPDQVLPRFVDAAPSLLEAAVRAR